MVCVCRNSNVVGVRKDWYVMVVWKGRCDWGRANDGMQEFLKVIYLRHIEQ